MSKIEFDINNYVEFELTEYGAKILNDRDKSFAEACPFVEAFQNKPTNLENQVKRMQLWQVISVFGEHTGLGLETFCKNATIVLEVKK